MSHLSEENRKTICSMIAHENKCCEIAERIGVDPTTIAKEVKRNRVISKDASKGQNKFLKNLIYDAMHATKKSLLL